MTLHATITCERDSFAGSQGCGYLTINTDADPAVGADLFARAEKSLTDKGWVIHDGKHYCPIHAPDSAGAVVEVGSWYVEAAPGVWMRRPPSAYPLPPLTVEVRTETPPLSARLQADADD